MDEILDTPLGLTPVMENSEVDTNVGSGDLNTPREETPYQIRVKRRIRFSAQKLRQNERKSDDDTGIQRKLNYGAIKPRRINTNESKEPICGHVKIKYDVEYDEMDTDHEWKVKDHEDYMVVNCRNHSEYEDKVGEMNNLNTDDLTGENEELVDDINDIRLSSEEHTEDDWSSGVNDNER